MPSILRTIPLGNPPWPTVDPFLFCVHHDDAYPAGNGHDGPAASLAGRQIGQDFAGKDGWRMYHGEKIPGFPSHPHRGFETVTVVRAGLIDHADSLGAAARFSSGDVQWMTAGAGIVHSEMFPLTRTDAPNPLELFQIWLNLPGKRKMVAPHFSMLWDERVPRLQFGEAGRTAEVTVIAGRFGEAQPPAPPPASWAAEPANEVAIWTIKLDAGAAVTLPTYSARAVRVVYFFRGDTLEVNGERAVVKSALQLNAADPTTITAGAAPVDLLVLQARPIGEPVAQHGPFVMNQASEIHEAYADFRRTQFGDWPWPSRAPVHKSATGRFARHADGRVEPGGG